MGAKSGDLVGDLFFKAGYYGYGHDHNSQAQSYAKHSDAYNGTRETAPCFPAADQAANDKKFGIQ